MSEPRQPDAEHADRAAAAAAGETVMVVLPCDGADKDTQKCRAAGLWYLGTSKIFGAGRGQKLSETWGKTTWAAIEGLDIKLETRDDQKRKNALELPVLNPNL